MDFTWNRTWHSGADVDLDDYSMALQEAARSLLARRAKRETWDGGPALLLLREAMLIEAKMLVGDGDWLLKEPVDAISLRQTRSLRWLGQLVFRIVKAAGWEDDFRCPGMAGLAEFKTLLAEVEAMEPAEYAIMASSARHEVPALTIALVRPLARRMDAATDLLRVTANELAAMRELGGEPVSVQ